MRKKRTRRRASNSELCYRLSLNELTSFSNDRESRHVGFLGSSCCNLD